MQAIVVRLYFTNHLAVAIGFDVTVPFKTLMRGTELDKIRESMYGVKSRFLQSLGEAICPITGLCGQPVMLGKWVAEEPKTV